MKQYLMVSTFVILMISQQFAVASPTCASIFTDSSLSVNESTRDYINTMIYDDFVSSVKRLNLSSELLDKANSVIAEEQIRRPNVRKNNPFLLSKVMKEIAPSEKDARRISDPANSLMLASFFFDKITSSKDIARDFRETLNDFLDANFELKTEALSDAQYTSLLHSLKYFEANPTTLPSGYVVNGMSSLFNHLRPAIWDGFRMSQSVNEVLDKVATTTGVQKLNENSRRKDEEIKRKKEDGTYDPFWD